MVGLHWCPRRAFDENRIAEFVRPILIRVEFTYHLSQGGIVGKGAEQLVVAAARLVGSGKNRVNNPQLGSRANSLCSQILTRADEPSTARRAPGRALLSCPLRRCGPRLRGFAG